jgi:hypothetical protein
MHLIATLTGRAYVLAADGTLYLLPGGGQPGNPVHCIEAEIAGLRGHAAWLRSRGREICADDYATAAEAIEQMAVSRHAAAA